MILRLNATLNRLRALWACSAPGALKIMVYLRVRAVRIHGKQSAVKIDETAYLKEHLELCDWPAYRQAEPDLLCS